MTIPYASLSSLLVIKLQAKSLAQGSKSDKEEIASESSKFANLYMNGSEVFKFAVRAVPMVSRIHFHQTVYES